MPRKQKSNSKKPINKTSKPKFRAPFKPIEIAIILAVVLLGTGGIVYQKHEQKIQQQLNTVPASNQSSSTPATSIQPVQTSTATGNAAKSTATAPASGTSGTGCTDATLAYTTTYQNVTWLPAGQTETQGGMNGSELFCKGKTPVISQPINKIIYVGIGTSSSSSTSQGSTSSNNGLTESQAAQQCDDNMTNGAGGDNPQSYYITCMNQYGY